MCYEYIVGIKGLCDDKSPLYYVDDFGISLQDASNMSDTRYLNGKEMFTRKLKLAWQSLIQDVIIKGFKHDHVMQSFLITNAATDTLTGGTKTLMIGFTDNCELTGVYINKIVVDAAVGGATTITINGDTYSATLTTGLNTIYVNKTYDKQVSISIDLSAITVNTGKATLTSNGNSACMSSVGESYGMSVTGDYRCNIESYLCRFPDKIGLALAYKTTALLYKELMLTTSLSEILFVKDKQSIMTEIASLDSDENLFQYDDKTAVTDTIKVAKGKYQKQIDIINRQLPLPKCLCCLQAVKSQYLVSIP
jgi:hypothetical protein